MNNTQAYFCDSETETLLSKVHQNIPRAKKTSLNKQHAMNKLRHSEFELVEYSLYSSNFKPPNYLFLN